VDNNIKTLPKSLQRLIGAIEKEHGLTPARFSSILEKAKVKESDLMPWATFNHPASDSYGRVCAYDGGYFEIMVMSWVPGDFSAIHDHGYTQWGAVQIFGAAEHAVFTVQDNVISTAIRHPVTPSQIIPVSHDVVHQMGNPGGNNFLSLHIYGNDDRPGGDITADARIFDLAAQKIHTTSGGVFYNLPNSQCNKTIHGPKPDFASWLRDISETIHRVRKRGKKNQAILNQLLADFHDPQHIKRLIQDLKPKTDQAGKITHSHYWNDLKKELMVASDLELKLQKQEKKSDHFQTYANLYDEVIGKPCLKDFMKQYLRFIKKSYRFNFKESQLLSIGCGTGLVEDYMIRNMGMPKENLLGLDISKAMVNVASQRVHAELGDLLELDPRVKMWDMAYCGLNVFQYLDHRILENVIRQTSRVLYPGGLFFGDFITPDHIRWYPNVIVSENKKVVSLRTPELIEKEFCMYQRSQIFNISTLNGQLKITHEGSHERFLPSMRRVYSEFKKVFAEVDLYDAVTLEALPDYADTCHSTRYLVVAKKLY
jgi:SAM-dependent methyltransferase/predicted metal-dependent enzyme (double-stranded beta helix superfamily)